MRSSVTFHPKIKYYKRGIVQLAEVGYVDRFAESGEKSYGKKKKISHWHEYVPCWQMPGNLIWQLGRDWKGRHHRRLISGVLRVP